MKPLTLFVMTGCPYCRQAKQALKELYAEKEEYRTVPIHEINESLDPETADRYDYYYVPSIFLGDRKLYEARPGESYDECLTQIKASLDAALQA